MNLLLVKKLHLTQELLTSQPITMESHHQDTHCNRVKTQPLRMLTQIRDRPKSIKRLISYTRKWPHRKGQLPNFTNATITKSNVPNLARYLKLLFQRHLKSKNSPNRHPNPLEEALNWLSTRSLNSWLTLRSWARSSRTTWSPNGTYCKNLRLWPHLILKPLQLVGKSNTRRQLPQLKG